MPEQFNLSLGGLTISLIPDQTLGEFDLVKRTIDFRTLEAPEILLKVHCGWFPDLNGGEVFFDTAHTWQMLRVEGSYVIKVCTPDLAPYQVGVFSPDFRSGDIYIASNEETPRRYIFPLSYPMGELFLMNLLGTGYGILFHATGVIDQGKGYLFTGHGGAGKTTIARLWDGLTGVQVVNDDKVIVRKEAEEFRLYGTPWHGDGGMALPDSAPLSMVFILKQATKNYSKALHPVEVAGSLLARAFVPLWDDDKITYSLAFLDTLSQGIPCLELGFRPETSIVNFVRDLAQE